MPREVMGPKRGPLNFPGRAAPGWDNTTDRLGYDGSGRNITKRYLSAKPNAQYGYADTTALVGQTTAYDHGGNKFYERSLQAVDRSNLYQPVDNSGNIASPTPGYDSVGRLLQYQRGELNSTGGYQNNGGGSVAAAIALPNTDQSRNYTLDGLGNWRATGFTPVGSAAQVDRRNNNYVNQITQRSVAGGTAVVFEYDNNSSPLPGNGNLTYDGTLNYQYDALNRLIAVNRVSDGAAIAAYVYDAGNRRVRKTVTNGGLAGNIPNGTTDSCWFGWQTMEERNPSGGTDTPTKQYVWGNYIDECLQLNLLAVAGPQQLAVGVYYPLQDTLYRTMALVNSSGTPVEACDTDAYGNTTIFTGPGPDGTWFTDDDLQSSYGANNIIYCGYRYDAETENYYVRNRYYSPTLGRWLTRDPIGYQGGIKLYGYVGGRVLSATDSSGHEWIKVPGIQLCEAYIPESLLYSLHFAHAWVSIAGVGSWGFHPGPAAAGNIGVIVPQPRLIKRDWNYGKFPDKGAPGWQNGYKVCYPLSVHSCRCDPNKAAAGVRAALAAERKKPAPDYSVEFFDCYDWAISTIVKGAMAGCKKGNYWYGLPKPDIKINGATYPAWPLPVIA